MNFINNRNWLRQHFRPIAEVVREWEEKEPTGTVLVEPAKTGELTLKIEEAGKWKYLHSKYDPLKETERLLKSYHSEHKTPVLFFGIGLGYHIDAFIEQNPGVKVALYEPNEEVLLAYLKRVDLRKYLPNTILFFSVEKEIEKLEVELVSFLNQVGNKLTFISLPNYEKTYSSLIYRLQEVAIEQVKNKKSGIEVEIAFQKRWITNAIKNAPTVLQTPNMLVDVAKEAFKDKPAIIVAAGPSLNREIDHLKKIKAEGRAYLFSVGSAVNTLIRNGIEPDAICTYDPQGHNEQVIKIVRERGIETIPLIFGSSVGFETLPPYLGPKFHMLTSQDTVIPSLVNKRPPFVNDAPSIAVVTYHLLTELGCNPIILVGQNLAYLEGEHYATGIDYGETIKQRLEQGEVFARTKGLVVKGNQNEELITNEGFLNMKMQLEWYISQVATTTINTTVGGAHIEGAAFMRLEELFTTYLKEHNQVEEWQVTTNGYDRAVVKQRIAFLEKERQKLTKQVADLFTFLKKLASKVEKKTIRTIENDYGLFDQKLSDLQENGFYENFVEPMIRVQFNLLRQIIEDVRYEKEAMKKAVIIVESFQDYLNEVYQHTEYATELVQEMVKEIEEGEERVC